jgi:hypothetical protein
VSAFPFLKIVTLSGGSDVFFFFGRGNVCLCDFARWPKSVCRVLLKVFVIVGSGLEVVEFAVGAFLRPCAFAGLRTGFSALR